MSQKTLITKKKFVNDEFYTEYADIEKEINGLLKENPFLFSNSTIINPCDGKESNFLKFFKDHFKAFNISNLIATSYSEKGSGRWYRKDSYHENSGSLEENGDFRNKEIMDLMRKSDFIITNPPFSLARDFFRILFALDKKFIILGNLNMINFREIIPGIINGRVFVSKTAFNQGMFFRNGNSESIRIPGIVWFTNIDFPERHVKIGGKLLTKTDNEEKYINSFKNLYKEYDNYPHIIEIPKVSLIPKDYYGLMGVPITFIRKYCPEEFSIKWIAGGNITAFTPGNILSGLGYLPLKNDKGGCPMINGKRIYSRMIIQRKKLETVI